MMAATLAAAKTLEEMTTTFFILISDLTLLGIAVVIQGAQLGLRLADGCRAEACEALCAH
jgi:hypothetical protein